MEIVVGIAGVIALIVLFVLFLLFFLEGPDRLTIEKIVPLMEHPLRERDPGKLNRLSDPPNSCLESDLLTILRWERSDGTERIAIHAWKHTGTIGITYRGDEVQDWQHDGTALPPPTEDQRREVSRLFHFVHSAIEHGRTESVVI